jgi:hypothetical protein
VKVGDRVMMADANELRSDGQPNIPAYRDMRGTVVSVASGIIVCVKWDCDRDTSLVHQSDLALACTECKGRGWHVGECHPREACGACENGVAR